MSLSIRLKALLALGFAYGFIWGAKPAYAQFDSSQFGNIDSLLSDNSVKQFVSQLGFGASHRPYQPATPLGTSIGLELGAEVTLFYLSDAFRQALDDSGFSSGDLPPSLPAAKLHLHKGLSESTDLGLSLFAYTQYLLVGGDLKFAFLSPSEGLMGAFRIVYNYTTVSLATVQTLSPQILFSRKLNFADPYIGLGLQYAWGSVSVPLNQVVTMPAGAEADLGTATKSGSAFDLTSFLGVGLKFGPTGLKLTLEGSYSVLNIHTLGIVFGLAL